MTLTTAHSLWLAPLCAVVGVLLAWILYRRSMERHGWTKARALAMAVVRAVVVTCLAFLLLDPMIRTWNTEVRKPVVVIAHDGSSSLMVAGDTAGVRTTYREKLERLASDLAGKFQVRSFTYGARVKEGLAFDQLDGQTDIDQVFHEAYDRFGGPDLGAVIIDGDGIYNRGRDPRQEAERLGVPVFTIALGDTTVRPDLVLKNVEHNRLAFLGNEVPVLLRVEARHLRGGRSRASVRQDKEDLAVKEVVITGDPMFTEIPLLIRPRRPGLQRFTVGLAPVDGEATRANNAQDIYIDVVDDRQKVLIVAAAPHPDVGSIRQALARLEGYETTLVYAADPPPDVAGFDLVVLHQLPARQHPAQTLLQRVNAAGLPILYVLGAASDLAAYSALGAGLEVTGAQRASTDATAAFGQDFTLFTMDPGEVRTIERFPPLQVPFGTYATGVATKVLFQQKVGVVRTEYPLFAFKQDGERHIATICGEGLWRWRLADHQQNGGTDRFDRLVHKLTQFLALKVDKSRFRVDHAPEFAEGDRVIINAESYNASFEPVNAPEALITLTDEDGREYPYTFGRTGNSYRLDAGMLPPGRYTYAARTEQDGQRLTAGGEFLVKAMMAERMSTVADHGLMESIAAKTGGAMVRPDGLASIQAALEGREQLVARSYRQAGFSELINLRWLFLLFFVLLAIEWSVRRYSGAY